MSQLRPRSLRTRLTLHNVAVLAGVLLIYGGSISAGLLLELRGQLDRLAIEDLETMEGYFRFSPDGTIYLLQDRHDHPYPPNMQERFVEVRAEDGAVLYRSARLGSRTLDGVPEPDEGVNSYSQRTVRLADQTRVRVTSRRHAIEGRPTVIRLGFSEEHMLGDFWQFVGWVVAGLPLALGLAGLGGFFLARRALAPIARMARRALEINAEQLSARLDVENPEDEMGHLASAVNQTLERLERSFQQLRQFTSDAAHELRTPLTAIRAVGEVGLQCDGSREQYREVIGSMLEESGRLSRLVDTLLTMARADSGQIQLDRNELCVLHLVREAVSFLDVLADEKHQTLHVSGDNTAHVHADRIVLRQVLINLLDNAIKYSPANRQISVSVFATRDQTVTIEVEDTGLGIPPEHRDRVFDRFYRVDKSRYREAGGAGLGLAIAKWGAEAHGGHLELRSSADAGCTFRLTLPAVVQSNDDTLAVST